MIKVYIIDFCFWCVKVKNYFKLENFEFEELNV